MWGKSHCIEKKNQALMFNERNLTPIDVSTSSAHIFWIDIWCSAKNNSCLEYLKVLKLLKEVAWNVLLNECLLEWVQLWIEHVSSFLILIFS